MLFSLVVLLFLCSSLGSIASPKPAAVQVAERNAAVLSCFSKIRFSTNIQPEWRQQVDRLASIAALDQISVFLQSKAIEMCTRKERDAVENFLEAHADAIEIADSVSLNFTNGERDLLNAWNNLNDTDSERRFYLSKFQQLSEANQTALRDAFGQIFNAYLVSSPPLHFIKFLGAIAPKDLARLKHFENENKDDEMKKIISSHLRRLKLNSMESFEIRHFMNGVFHLSNGGYGD